MDTNITHKEISNFLKKQPLIKGLDEIDLSYLVDIAEKCSFEPGEVIILEGELSTELYFILEGQVQVVNIDSASGKEYILNTMGKEESFGDLAFLDNEPRSSSIKALTKCLVLKIAKETSFIQSTEMTNICNKISNNIARIIIKRLRDTNQASTGIIYKEVNYLLRLIDLGKLFILTLLLYWGLALMLERTNTSGTTQSAIQFFLTAVVSFLMILKFHDNFAYFGLALKNWEKRAKRVFLILFGLVALFAFLYLVGRYLRTIYPEIQWFNFTSIEWRLSLLFYPLFIFLKEFIVRGVLFTSLRDFLIDTKTQGDGNGYSMIRIGTGLVVLFISIIMTLFNFNLGSLLIITTFIVNFVLGYFYIRINGLVAITLIHCIIGLLLVIMGIVPQYLLYKI
jgi:CRP-like cAMP-binding protein